MGERGRGASTGLAQFIGMDIRIVREVRTVALSTGLAGLIALLPSAYAAPGMEVEWWWPLLLAIPAVALITGIVGFAAPICIPKVLR